VPIFDGAVFRGYGAAGRAGGAAWSYGVATFAAPLVAVVVNAQSVAESFVSVPSGSRDREPSTVFESATVAGRAVPSTS
jgi:hypothetical protein